MLLILSLGLVPLLFPPAFQDPVGDLEVPASVLQDDGEYFTLDLSELDDGGLTLRQFINTLAIPDTAKQQLLKLTPANYIGDANSLAEKI